MTIPNIRSLDPGTNGRGPTLWVLCRTSEFPRLMATLDEKFGTRFGRLCAGADCEGDETNILLLMVSPVEVGSFIPLFIGLLRGRVQGKGVP